MPEYCPVLRPTYEQFIHVKQYIKSIEHIVQKHGICKIIPPPSWNPRHSMQCICGPGNFSDECTHKAHIADQSDLAVTKGYAASVEMDKCLKYDTDRFGTDGNADRYIKASTTQSAECLCGYRDLFGDDITDSLFNLHARHCESCRFYRNQYRFTDATQSKYKVHQDDTSSIGSNEEDKEDVDVNVHDVDVPMAECDAVKSEVLNTKNITNGNYKLAQKSETKDHLSNDIKMEIKPEKAAKAMDVQRSAEVAVGEQTASSTKTDAQSLKGGVKKEQSKSFDATFVAPETQRADRNKYGYPESYRELMDNTDFEHQHRTSYQGQCIERSPYRYVSVQDIHHYVHVYLAFDHLWYEGKIVAVDTSTNSCDIKLVHNGDVITMYPHESVIIKLSKKVESEPVTQSARVDVDMHIDDDAVYRKCIKKMKHNELMGYHRNEDDQYHHYAKTKESKPAKVPFCRSMMAHELPSRLSDISNIQHWREMGKIPRNVINSYVSMNMTIYEDDDYFSDGKDFNEYSGHADHSLSDVTLKAKHLTDTNDTVQYLADMIIKAPIRQNLYQSPDAKGGVYHCVNVVEHERMSVRYFYEKTESELQREIKESKKTKEIMQWIENNEIEQHMDEIQREWIRNLTYRHPLYGADSIGSLFHPQQIWNLANMDTVLNLISNDIQGVTIPYLYFGSWRSMFAWHIEDRALWAVNYLHFGKPKIWFGVPPSDCDKMEQVLAANYPKDAAFCHVFTRHKSSFVAPKLLEKAGVRVYRAVQRANEIIISSPKAYHSGFNLGFNCAEAVNLAMPSWIPVGIAAPHCQCGLMQSSVKFDIIALIDEIKHKYPALAADIPPLPKNYRKILQSQNTPKRQLDCYYVPPAVKKRKLSNNTVVSTVTSSNVASPCTSTKTPAPSTPIAGTSEKATRGGRGRGRGRPPMNRMSRMMNKTYRFGSRNGRKNRKSDLNVPGLPSLIPPRTLMNLNMMNTNKNALVKPGK